MTRTGSLSLLMYAQCPNLRLGQREEVEMCLAGKISVNSCRTGSDFLTTILILASSLEPYVSIPRSLPRMSPCMSHRVSHRMSKYLFPLPNDDVVVILFATYLSPIWCIYRGSRALFNRQSSHT